VEHRRQIAGVAVALAAGATLFVGTGAASAAVCTSGAPSATTAYPPSQCSATASANVVAPGGSVTVAGSGFTPGHTVVVTLFPGGIRLGSATVSASGHVSVLVHLPSGLASGTYKISIFDPATGRQLLVQITVRPSGAGGGTMASALPRTGADGLVPLAAGGVALVIGAGGAVVLARRRRDSSDRPAA